MISEFLEIISREMKKIEVPYALHRWTGIVPNLYAIGEFMELPQTTEDFACEYTMMITITARERVPFATLDIYRDKIEQVFDPIEGLREKTYDNPSVNSVAIFYENAFLIETGEANLMRMQINLRIKQWKTFGGK